MVVFEKGKAWEGTRKYMGMGRDQVVHKSSREKGTSARARECPTIHMGL